MSCISGQNADRYKSLLRYKPSSYLKQWTGETAKLSYHVHLHAQRQKKDLPWLLEGAAMLAVGRERTSALHSLDLGDAVLGVWLILGRTRPTAGVSEAGRCRQWGPFQGLESRIPFLKCYQILSYHQVESGMLVQNLKYLSGFCWCLYNTSWRHTDASAQRPVVYCSMYRMNCDVCVWCY